jgi:hypothetical protein
VGTARDARDLGSDTLIRRGRLHAMPAAARRFSAELYEGHSDCAVLVPFDPSRTWSTEPRRIGYRKHVGHAVRGTVDGQPFESWIWFYFHEWRMVIDHAVLRAARVKPGDRVKIVVRPHPEPEAAAPYTPGGRSRAARQPSARPRPRPSARRNAGSPSR